LSEGRAYLSAEQLAAVTPWSVDAIEQMVRRGVFVRGIHYFQPQGPRSHRLFKWAAIAAWIEGEGAPPAARGASEEGAPRREGDGVVRDAEAIAERAARLRRLHAE
jgi:hypothetical protein